MFRANAHRRYRLAYDTQGLQEKFNILNDRNSRDLKDNAALKAKIIRYSNLKDIIEELNQNLDLKYVADRLTSISFSVVSGNRGVSILYFIDKQLSLQIFNTKKEDKRLTIRAKQGDIFDFWVLRHSSPLLLEDTRKDFRFDPQNLKTQDTRSIASLISSPIISEHRFFGILRLDSPEPNFYTQDDLRFLVKICDLGATALENSELFQRAQNLAIHDSLTALYTKGYFLERLKEECIRGSRKLRVFSLLMLDIDFFKRYNDKFGHTAGDIVLKELAETLMESLKELNPIVSRFGGEEFSVILPAIDGKGAFSIADSLRKQIENKKIILRRQKTGITVSIGISTFPADAAEAGELIDKADKAMYAAKQGGRNRVCCI